jgi:hypothetical protein
MKNQLSRELENTELDLLWALGHLRLAQLLARRRPERAQVVIGLTEAVARDLLPVWEHLQQLKKQINQTP